MSFNVIGLGCSCLSLGLSDYLLQICGHFLMAAIQVCNEKDQVGWREMENGQFEGTNNKRKGNAVLKACPERDKIAVIKKSLPDLQQSERKFLLSVQHGKKKDFTDITKNNKRLLQMWSNGARVQTHVVMTLESQKIQMLRSHKFLHHFRNLLRPDSMS